MAQKALPTVSDQLFYTSEGSESVPIVVGSPPWYNWLADEQNRSFSWRTALGTFTVRREHVRHGHYWYIYHRCGGKLRKAYLGRSEEVTLERFGRVAATLVAQPDADPPVGVHRSGEQARSEHPHPDSGSMLFPTTSAILPKAHSESVGAHPLPAPLTPLLGRHREVANACALLRRTEVRLLVITGSGGIGKTRLALQVATELRNHFPAGICFVALDALHDPALVAPTIAHALDLKEVASASVIEQLKDDLREKPLLLLLDNFEQVSPAAPLLTDLLITCPRLKLLVTSRARLHVRGEYALVVPPLALPDPQHLSNSETLAQYASVALFLQRAQAFQPAFQIHHTNARAIAEICAHLEGIPLAIELAAARITQLPPQALLFRLSQRLEVLTNGPKDAPVRQHTLRNTLAWSYSLLSPWEQWLFRRLSIFVGGWTLGAAETIGATGENRTNDAAAVVFEGIASLIDTSLLFQTELEAEEPRFGMLETTREYGRELLTGCEEMEATRRVHALSYLALAEQAAQAWEGPAHVMWLERIERDHENLRAAMQWSLERGEDWERMEIAFRLGSALRSFWQIRGYFREGRRFLEQVLAQSEARHSPLRTKVLNEAVHLATLQGDYAWGEALCQQNLARCRELGDGLATARALYLLGYSAFLQGNLTRASPLLEESRTLSQEVGDQGGMLMALFVLGGVFSFQGEYARAQEVLEQTLVLQRQIANKRGIAWSLTLLAGVLFLSQQDLTTASASLAEARALFQELDDKLGIAECYWRQGQIALEHAESITGRSLLEQSVTLFQELGNRKGMAHAFCLLGRAAAVQQDWTSAHAFSEESLKQAQAANDALEVVFCLEGKAGVVTAERASLATLLWAAQLWGAAEALREKRGAPLPPVERASYERSVATARNAVGKRLFTAYWTQGRSMTPQQAREAQGKGTMLSRPASPSGAISADNKAANPGGLTAREIEVLRWVARGLTDAQVAAQLVISPRTVTSHLSSIYNKLGISSRSAATRFAVDHQLA